MCPTPLSTQIDERIVSPTSQILEYLSEIVFVCTISRLDNQRGGRRLVCLTGKRRISTARNAASRKSCAGRRRGRVLPGAPRSIWNGSVLRRCVSTRTRRDGRSHGWLPWRRGPATPHGTQYRSS